MSDRTFRLILDGKKGGLVKGSSPSSAAKKACKKLSAEQMKNSSVFHQLSLKDKVLKTEPGKTSFKFELQETTKDSKKKVYGPYKGCFVKDKMVGGVQHNNGYTANNEGKHNEGEHNEGKKQKIGRKNKVFWKYNHKNHSSQQHQVWDDVEFKINPHHHTLEFKINQHLHNLSRALVKQYGSNIGTFIFIELRRNVLKLYESNPELFDFYNFYDIINQYVEPAIKAVKAKAARDSKDAIVPISFQKNIFDRNLLTALNKRNSTDRHARAANSNNFIVF